jgi:peptide/nickel transport system ATP-binding protein
MNPMTNTRTAEADSTAADSPVLEAKGVSRSYVVGEGWFGKRRFNAVANVDLQLNNDELLVIVGESGSGKTTLARMLAGLVRPSSGVVRSRGTELSKRSRRQIKEFRRHTSVVFQNPYQSLNPRMRVGSALAEALTVARVVEKSAISDEVDRLLTSVGLPTSYRQKHPVMLSGGERQRVAIARAIAGRPDVLIADEITSALDVSVSAQIVNLMLDLKSRRNFSCVFVTHDLALAMAIADRIMIMKSGEVVETGTPEFLQQYATNPYTKQLIELVHESLGPIDEEPGAEASRDE